LDGGTHLRMAGIAKMTEVSRQVAGADEQGTVQRQLPKNVSLTVAYVGTLSHHLPFMVDKNYAPYASGASTSQASINARRPYDPGILGQVTYDESNETASYHSIQISASRPLTHNLMINGFYVFSHSFQSVNESAIGQAVAQDFDNLREERGPTANDRRHVASISGLWNLTTTQVFTRS
jgi:hypothetical protein